MIAGRPTLADAERARDTDIILHVPMYKPKAAQQQVYFGVLHSASLSLFRDKEPLADTRVN